LSRRTRSLGVGAESAGAKLEAIIEASGKAVNFANKGALSSTHHA
jgi:hypothetical protein